MAFQEIKVPENASIAQKGLAWVDSRFPLSKLFKEHMSEYYAPKNFNFWYFFGSLAIVVLVIPVSYTHLRCRRYAVCRSRWSPYH